MLGVVHQREDVEIFGPVPSLMLFLFTLVVQVMEESRPRGKKELVLEFIPREKSPLWTLRWPFETQESKEGQILSLGGESSVATTRKELIRDLIQSCKAVVDATQGQSVNQIQISGSWKRPD